MSAEENEMKNRHPADENEKTMPETGADSFAAGEETDFVRMPGSREAARPARRKTIPAGRTKGTAMPRGRTTAAEKSWKKISISLRMIIFVCMPKWTI